MRCFINLLIFVSVIAGCSAPVKNSTGPLSSNHYARGFSIEKNRGFTKLTVFNPWERAKNISFDYYLVNKNSVVPDSIKDKKIIKTPLERVICLSTTHLAFLGALNETSAVTGISGDQYVSDLKIREKIRLGEVADVGYGQNLNYELIIKLDPELIMVYGIGSEVTGYTQKLEELGIPVVMMAEYLEETPLGKAEWVIFAGELFEKGSQACEYFLKIEEQYTKMKNMAAGKKTKPKVMVGSPYKDAWWVPGGQSYMANLIADAGGHYLGRENPSHESYVISFENALAWSNEADFWINTGSMASKNELISYDERFQKFKVFNQGKIYNNIKRVSPAGGNDFWESGTVNPQEILHDLICIFHPGLTDGELNYYIELK